MSACLSFKMHCLLGLLYVFQGLRFLHFPYLLTLQLKRFDFDYTTMHRIKLNDRMTFPEDLDMGSFIDIEDEVMIHVQLVVFKNNLHLASVSWSDWFELSYQCHDCK